MGTVWRLFKRYIVVRIGNIVLLPIIILFAIVSRYKKKEYDVGIGPIPMINNVYIKRALTRKGYKVETIAESVYYITDEFDFIYTKDRHLLYYYFPAFVFVRSILRYRCIYIYFNGFVLSRLPILRQIEPYLLKISNTKVVVMPYGSDHQSFKYAKNILLEHYICKDYSTYYKRVQPRVEKDVLRWTKMSDYVLAHQDCVDYLAYWDRARWSLFGVDTDVIVPAMTKVGEKIRIFHAPNHRGIKGSDALEKAIEELKSEKYNIEYVYAHGVSNKEIIELIQTCDIVVDQLIMGTYSMFSMEAMACGKAVVCYIRPDLKEFYEAIGVVEIDELPFISATVLTIKDALKKLIDERDKLEEYGQKARDYVVKYHSLDALGQFYDEVNRAIGIEVSN